MAREKAAPRWQDVPHAALMSSGMEMAAQCGYLDNGPVIFMIQPNTMRMFGKGNEVVVGDVVEMAVRAAGGPPPTFRSKCHRFLATFASGTSWNHTLGPHPAGSMIDSGISPAPAGNSSRAPPSPSSTHATMRARPEEAQARSPGPRPRRSPFSADRSSRSSAALSSPRSEHPRQV